MLCNSKRPNENRVDITRSPWFPPIQNNVGELEAEMRCSRPSRSGQPPEKSGNWLDVLNDALDELVQVQCLLRLKINPMAFIRPRKTSHSAGTAGQSEYQRGGTYAQWEITRPRRRV